MTTQAPVDPRGSAPSRAAIVGALAIAVVIAAGGLLWSKWVPYLQKATALADTHTWSGSSILAAGGVEPGDAPSWHAATSFASAYVPAIWKALVAALLISAAISSLVPTGWAARVMNARNPVAGAAIGGLASTPSLMCTCCTAPVVATLRRAGVGLAPAVAYWLGNPLLNPAVLVFLGLVAPWQWTATRLVVGLLVVVLGSVVVARLAGPDATKVVPAESDQPLDGAWLAGAPSRFAKALLRLGLVLIPEYLVVVLVVGAFRGWLLPAGTSGVLHSTATAIVLCAVVGTLLVLPTGGEIPILAGLAAVGVSAGGIGALLVTLPAASLPAMAMLVRTFGWRATTATAGVVAVGGLVGGGVLALIA